MIGATCKKRLDACTLILFKYPTWKHLAFSVFAALGLAQLDAPPPPHVRGILSAPLWYLIFILCKHVLYLFHLKEISLSRVRDLPSLSDIKTPFRAKNCMKPFISPQTCSVPASLLGGNVTRQGGKWGNILGLMEERWSIQKIWSPSSP